MSYFLRQIYAERYGAYTKREIGPFAPGLNVVFGPNEAGKTTFTSLVDGVLFGWRESHGTENTYAPSDGARSGMLTFETDEENTSKLVRIVRVGDEDKRQTDAKLAADIDAATYRSMFSFSSDELRSLKDTSDVTARLLSAGSGTNTSPTVAYLQIEQRIAECTSLSPDASDSVIVLAQELDEKRAQVEEGQQRVKLLKQKDHELRELQSNKETAAAHLQELDAQIDALSAFRQRAKNFDEQQVALRDELEQLADEKNKLVERTQAQALQDVTPELLELDAHAERDLNDKFDEYDAQLEKAKRVLDTAEENCAVSTAHYEAVREFDVQAEDAQGAKDGSIRDRIGRIVLPILPSIVFIAAGVPLFIYARQVVSLSFTVLALLLVGLAIILGVAAAASLRRIVTTDSNLETRMKDAQWVMLQDKKRLDASRVAYDELAAEITAFLENHGFEQANGSLRQARALLSEAQEVRGEALSIEQRLTAIELRRESIEHERAQLEEARATEEKRLQLPRGLTLSELDEIIQARIAQRNALREVADSSNVRIGQLQQELAEAFTDKSLDQLKLEREVLRTRLREAKYELVQLLLARRMLERAMASWELDSQPRVYEEASRLLGIITDGQWVKVSVSSTGSVVATDCEGNEVKPRHLSLGTCQQLYLSLRVALLLTARDVGRAMPVMADDILVHFDEQRRRGAARVIAELAQVRQVILFTCHQETVDALKAADPSFTFLKLSRAN